MSKKKCIQKKNNFFYMENIIDKNGKTAKLGDIYKHNDNEFVIWQTLDLGTILIEKSIFTFQKELGKEIQYATTSFAKKCGKYSEIIGTVLIDPITPTEWEIFIEDKYIIIDNLEEFDEQFKPSNNYPMNTNMAKQQYERVMKKLSETIITDNEHRVICVNYDDEGYALFGLKWNCEHCAIIEYTGTAK